MDETVNELYAKYFPDDPDADQKSAANKLELLIIRIATLGLIDEEMMMRMKMQSPG